MRKIYGHAPDAPQVVANRAVDIIERHFSAAGVRRAEELPEESKVHLLRELQSIFASELPDLVRDKSGTLVYNGTPERGRGLVNSIINWLDGLFRQRNDSG